MLLELPEWRGLASDGVGTSWSKMSRFRLVRRGLKVTKNAGGPIPPRNSELSASQKLVYFAAGNTLRSSTP